MDGTRHRSLSLVIPAYNEADGIGRVIAEADDALHLLASDYEILVVDDGSSDATAACVRAAAEGRPRVRLLIHPENRGYGAALRTGFEAARFDRVAFTDADCQFDLADLADLLPLSDRVPVVVGFRRDRQDPWRRRFLSQGYNLLARTLLGTRVRDCDCALKVFRRDALAGLLPESRGFFVNTEMLARARQQGLAVAEVGVTHRPRLRGRSKVSLTEVPKTLAALLPFWWSRVLFAGPAAAPADGGTPSSAGRWGPALLLALTALLFFCRLRCPLLEPEEVRYAEIPRQMLLEDRLVVPTLHGQAYLDKPPLFYWLVMASYRLFGVHDWAARLVPGLAGWLTVAAVYFWGRRTVGVRAALAGAAVLCLAPEFVYRGRMLTMNGLLALWVTLALAAGHLALTGLRLRWGWWLASAVACGLGLLTKGPVALVLAVPPLAAAALLDQRLAWPGVRAWAGFLAAAGALAAPWYLAAAWSEPDFARYFFWQQHVLRYVDTLDHREPFWFYLPGLLLGLLPWSLLLLPLARLLGRRKGMVAGRRPAALGVALLAAGWAVLFFSLADCKRAVYLLPAFPPLALALGCTIDLLLPRERLAGTAILLWRRRSPLAFGTAAGVLGLALAVCLAAGGTAGLKPARAELLAGLAAAALIGLVLARHRASWGMAGGVAFAVLLAGTHEWLPGYHRKFSLRGPVREQVRRADAEGVAVFCYPRRWDSVSFYLRRNDVAAFPADKRAQLVAELQERPRSLVFVKTPHLDDLLQALPPGLEFVPHSRREWVTVGEVRPRGAVEAPGIARAEVRDQLNGRGW